MEVRTTKTPKTVITLVKIIYLVYIQNQSNNFIFPIDICRFTGKKKNLIRKTMDRSVWFLFLQTACHNSK